MLLTVIATLTAIVGCRRAEDPAVVAQRAKYLLNEEPAGALGVTEAHAQVTGQADATRPLVLVGRIGAGSDPTWDPHEAAFVISDPAAELPDHEHGASHDDNCPFCQAKKQATMTSTALIRVVDEKGQVVAMNAKKLLALAEGQIVVVRGTASIDSLGHLVVAADGVYARR
jgi:hypothetical protein